jgi:hypothetical protein
MNSLLKSGEMAASPLRLADKCTILKSITVNFHKEHAHALKRCFAPYFRTVYSSLVGIDVLVSLIASSCASALELPSAHAVRAVACADEDCSRSSSSERRNAFASTLSVEASARGCACSSTRSPGKVYHVSMRSTASTNVDKLCPGDPPRVHSSHASCHSDTSVRTEL